MSVEVFPGDIASIPRGWTKRGTVRRAAWCGRSGNVGLGRGEAEHRIFNTLPHNRRPHTTEYGVTAIYKKSVISVKLVGLANDKNANLNRDL